MANSQRKKKSILINPKFQWTLIGYAALVAVIILATVYAFFSYGFHEFIQFGQQAGLSDDHVYFQFIQMQENAFQKVIVTMAIAVAAILIMGGLVVSHKIAGPLYRLRKEFLSMASKSEPGLHKINFREGDFFPEVPQAFNQLVERITSKRP